MNREVSEPLVSADQLVRMRIDGPCELVAGRVALMSPAGRRHGIVVGRILEALGEHVKHGRLGLVTSGETGFLVRRDPDTVRAPDVAFVSRATLARSESEEGPFFPMAPDLAVEVLSPDDTFANIESKVREYLAAGAGAVWVVSPFGRVVHLYEAQKPLRVLDESAEIDGGTALPGFRCKVADFFQDLPR